MGRDGGKGLQEGMTSRRLASLAFVACTMFAGLATKSVSAQMSNNELIAMLASRDSDQASKATQEIVGRGEVMLPLLVALRNDKHPFHGSGFGAVSAGDFTLKPLPKQKLPKEFQTSVITMRVAGLYLVSAIYYGRLDFAQSPFLTPVGGSRESNRNNDKQLEDAWRAASKWVLITKERGLEHMKSRHHPPLRDSGLVFWGTQDSQDSQTK
jgi:hypothetical protein